MRSIAALIVLALTGSLASGCAKKETPVVSARPETKAAASATVAEVPAPATNPATSVVPGAPQQPGLVSVTGTVLETIDASDYTYMRLQTEGGEGWAAVTKAKVKKGQKVTIVNAMSMDGFESKTLKRKFDHLVFGSLGEPGVASASAAAVPASAGHAPMISDHAPTAGSTPAMKEQMAAQHGQAAGGPEDTPDVKVPKADGANAKTVAEVWAERAALKGKDVVVKAKVMKVTSGVMGKNWLHVRDGSGSKEKKDNDLTVTTDAVAKAGDVVTVSGAISVDKDFGAGYAYPVILENAKIGK